MKRDASDLESEIYVLRSRSQLGRMLRWVGSDKKRFARVMESFLSDDQELARRAAWIVGHAGQCHPELIEPWIHQLVRILKKNYVHEALHRCAMGVLQEAEIPETLKGSIAALCFRFLADTKKSAASRVFAMTVFANIAKGKPALMRELHLIVEQTLPYSPASFRARARHVLKETKSRTKQIPAADENALVDRWLMKKK